MYILIYLFLLVRELQVLTRRQTGRFEILHGFLINTNPDTHWSNRLQATRIWLPDWLTTHHVTREHAGG